MISKKYKLSAFIIGCLLGAVFFVLIYGINVLDFKNENWLLTGYDIKQHFLGWVYYRKSEWHFPLGLLSGEAYPYYTSILYTDSIPLFSFVFKLLSPILPDTFQFFGLFGLTCYMLNGGIAAIIIVKFCDNLYISSLGSIFFIIASPVLQRLYGYMDYNGNSRHTALAAHFLIYGSIAIWLYHDKIKSTKTLSIIWGIVAFLSISIESYFIFMVGGIMCGFLLHDLLKNKKIIRTTIIFGSFVATTLITIYLWGGFYGNVSSGAIGFGWFSSNINTLINPLGFSSILPTLPLNGVFQYEGFAYLGLGMILLCLLVIVSIAYSVCKDLRKKVLWKTIKDKMRRSYAFAIPMTIVIVIFGSLALTNTITLNSKVILFINTSKKLDSILTIFRSSGRFIWCIMYLLMFGSIIYIIKNYQKKFVVMVLLICTILQIADLHIVFHNLHRTYSVRNEYKSQILDDKLWSKIPDNYAHLVMMPILDLDALKLLDLAKFCDDRDMTMNYFYFSRQYDYYLKSNNYYSEQFSNHNFDEKTLYLLDLDNVKSYNNELNTYLVNDYYIASVHPIPGLIDNQVN